MDFVDTTLQRHHASNIQKFCLYTDRHMNASRVCSWIENLGRCNVEDLSLYLDLDEDFFVPPSLFTSESLIKLELSAPSCDSCSMPIHLPNSFSCPKLKSLTLHQIQFTEDKCWNDQHFSNCPLLEDLTLEDCTWANVGNFCISTPALKVLKFYAWDEYDNSLQDCALQINAPNLVSLTYFGRVSKDYVLSSFPKLESAEVLLCSYGVRRVKKIGYGAAASKIFQALSHVQCLEMHVESLQALPTVDDLVHALPVYHNLERLILKEGLTTDNSLISLLKAVPNLRWLDFEESCICIDENKEEEHEWAGHMLTAGWMFQHLDSVSIGRFRGTAREMRWVKLILKNAKTLKAVILDLNSVDAINREVHMAELLSLPRASDRFFDPHDLCIIDELLNAKLSSA
ncbi:F-box/LRR-repeat protein At4g14103-like [Papaver somniferum]|uniref:F-box/LRR-repeat protein At4g14103-like n=1 Tax=Papaver somniferum TaxID=3469 RepID=UPI000E6FCF81|nr:F-box/LRR-repeat protein At4g14103-like [Papaver somniferum]